MSPDQKDHIVITASRSSLRWFFKDLIEYRELLFFLMWRDIKVRYKQTFIGAGWAILQPFTTMVVFTIFFGKLGKIPSDGVPYPIFSYAALVPWTFFAMGLSSTSNSLITSSNLIKKVYFPRLILPIASVFTRLADFFMAFAVLIVMMLFYGMVPTANIIWLPFFLLLALISSLAVGLWLSALNVHFRDVQYTLPFLTQLWLFVTPIVYPSSLLPEPWRTLYGLNPMAGVVEGFRWALLGVETKPGAMLIVSTLAALVMLVTGVFYFRKMERTFADII